MTLPLETILSENNANAITKLIKSNLCTKLED